MMTAKIQAGRFFGVDMSGTSIINPLAALNSSSSSLWPGRVMGPLRLVAEAAKFHGAALEGNFAKHAGRYLAADASPHRWEVARSDMGTPNSSENLFAWLLGGRPIH